MNLLDIILLVIVAAGLFTGYRRGILSQAASLVGIILGIIMCRIFGGAMARAFTSPTDTEQTLVAVNIMCYLLVLIVCYMGMRAISGTIRTMFKALHLGIIDNIAGAVFRALEWLFALSMLLNVLQVIMPRSEIRSSSPKLTEWIYDFGPDVIGSGVIQGAYHAAGDLEDSMRRQFQPDSDSIDVSGTIIDGTIQHAILK